MPELVDLIGESTQCCLVLDIGFSLLLLLPFILIFM